MQKNRETRLKPRSFGGYMGLYRVLRLCLLPPKQPCFSGVFGTMTFIKRHEPSEVGWLPHSLEGWQIDC